MRVWALALTACLAATGAHAFDCGKASTEAEKEICADPAARAADADMSKAYAALVRGASAKSKAQIARAQVNWLERRDGACSRENLAACLAEQSRQRAKFLAAQPEAGPGLPSPMTAKIWYDKLAKGQVDVDYELLEFAAPSSPGERAFNAAVEKLQDDAKPLIADRGDEGAASLGATMRLVYASPALVSARAELYVDGGGAHPNMSVRNFNLDIARGRLLAFADAFDAAAAKTVAARCFKSVVEQKRARLGDDAPKTPDELKELEKAVGEATGDLALWSFSASKAVIAYDRDTVGGWAEGDYACEIGYGVLRPLTKSGLPLP